MMDIKKYVEPSTYEFESILKSVSDSRCFGRSERQLRLFKYLLEKTISEQSHRIKQYAIALDVFDRPTSFDQQTDSIVRVEMHRLRRNLTKFNTQSKTIQITIPKGQFNVVIRDTPKRQLTAIFKRDKVIKPNGFYGAALTLAVILSLIGLRALKVSPPVDKLACSELLPNISIEIEQMRGLAFAEIERSINNTVSQFTNFNIVNEDCQGEVMCP